MAYLKSQWIGTGGLGLAVTATAQQEYGKNAAMSYYSLLGLIRDPFVTTPDPDLFFRCPNQLGNLERLEIGVRLRRGLSVVLGPVGTGKSTLSRQLMRMLSENPEFVTILMLDPLFETEKEMLAWLNREFEIPAGLVTDSIWQLKDNLKNKLYSLGVEQSKTVCLIVDEGQKITKECLEVLRELLNYETNDFKLLQIVLFAQEEFEPTLGAMPNLSDRIYQRLRLGFFSFTETREMIRTRMEMCKADGPLQPLFTPLGYLAVYLATGGYPRKVIQLCHKVMLAAVGLGRNKAGWDLVLDNADKEASALLRFRADLALLGLLGLAGGYLIAWLPPVRSWLAGIVDALGGLPPLGG
jgi:general secretion pathway protein A